MVQFFLKLLLKQRILAVYHDFHQVLVATKFLTAKLHSLYVVESRKFWKGRESGVGNFNSYSTTLINSLGHVCE